MMYFKWAILAFGNLILKYFVAYPLTPIIVLFAKGNGHLPVWLYIFDTPDNTLDGDVGWRLGTRPIKAQKTRLDRYINRCFWLWRNSLYGFNKRYLSVVYDIDDYLVWEGNKNVTNAPNGVSGVSKAYLCRGEKVIAWQYYYIRQLKNRPAKCIRILLGYKLFQFNQKLYPGKVSLALSVGINKFQPLVR